MVLSLSPLIGALRMPSPEVQLLLRVMPKVLKRGSIFCVSLSIFCTYVPIRNAIGAYGGSYCIYRALAVAIGDLPSNYRPNFDLTEPTYQIGPHASWFDPEKIVSIDPFGHVAPAVFKAEYEAGLDVRYVFYLFYIYHYSYGMN
jgi:hypothetical protein